MEDGIQKRKIYESLRLYIILNYILIIFTIVTVTRIHIGQKELKVQMFNLNKNMDWLIRKYDKLNPTVNRNRRSFSKVDFYKDIKKIEYLNRKLFNLLEKCRNQINTKSDTYSNNMISPVWSQSVHYQNNVTKINHNTRLNNMTLLITPKNSSVVDFNKIQYPVYNLSSLHKNYKMSTPKRIKDKKIEVNMTKFLSLEGIQRIMRSR